MGTDPSTSTAFYPNSELSREDQAAIRRHRYTQDDYGLAMKTLMSTGMGQPDHSQVEVGAKILGAVPDKVPGGREEPDAMWLMTESMILTGRG